MLVSEEHKLLARLRLPSLDPGQHNKSDHGHYSDYYTRATKARVTQLFRADLEEFGYTFEAR